MSEPSELTDARNAVLRKIGRNVLNLQKMEGMLKLLNIHGNISGKINDLAAIQRQKSKSISRQSMGRLATAFVQSVYSGPSGSSSELEVGGKASASISFSIEGDETLSDEREKALLSVVEERNRLIHKMLIPFDSKSLASCKDLSAALDEQHEKILPEYDLLRSILNAFREGRALLAQHIESDGFISDLNNSADGA